LGSAVAAVVAPVVVGVVEEAVDAGSCSVARRVVG
jgi:hypothetical protein